MTEIRFNYGDKFTQTTGTNTGIGSTIPAAKLDVAGTASAGSLRVTGIATLSSVSGFVKTKLTTSTQDMIVEAGNSRSVSGEVVVSTGQTISVSTGATTGQGGIQSLKVYQTFMPPVGGIEDRPTDVKPGMVYYNKDFKTIEFWDGNFWKQVDNTTRSGRIIYAGGNNTGANPYTIDEIVFLQATTKGNALEFGILTQATRNKAAGSSGTRGVFAAGASPNNTTNTNVIEFITIQSKGNSFDFGDVTAARRNVGGTSSSTRMLIAGGYVGSPSTVNTIDYVEMHTLGNALDFGDLSMIAPQYVAGCMSPVRALYFGGSATNIPRNRLIDKISFASKGNSTNFGLLSGGGGTFNGTQPSSNTRGVIAGASQPERIKYIEYVTIASEGNTVHFGDLTVARNGSGSGGGGTRGLWAGGTGVSPSYTYSNIIDFITISTAGDAEDFGDIATKSSGYAGCSDTDGGLGGF